VLDSLRFTMDNVCFALGVSKPSVLREITTAVTWDDIGGLKKVK
jgi:hypothetical protein